MPTMQRGRPVSSASCPDTIRLTPTVTGCEQVEMHGKRDRFTEPVVCLSSFLTVPDDTTRVTVDRPDVDEIESDVCWTSLTVAKQMTRYINDEFVRLR